MNVIGYVVSDPAGHVVAEFTDQKTAMEYAMNIDDNARDEWELGGPEPIGSHCVGYKLDTGSITYDLTSNPDQ